jgi:hypothetical protein
VRRAERLSRQVYPDQDSSRSTQRLSMASWELPGTDKGLWVSVSQNRWELPKVQQLFLGHLSYRHHQRTQTAAHPSTLGATRIDTLAFTLCRLRRQDSILLSRKRAAQGVKATGLNCSGI